MTHLKTAALLSAVTVALAACASAPDTPPVYSESFIAHITEQGNRMFTYSASLSMEQQGRIGRGGRGPGGGGKGGGPAGGGRGGMDGGPGGGMAGGMDGSPGGGISGRMRENPEKAARERLDTVLASTNYCPHGWFTIEQTAQQGSVEIKGECRAR